jgi:hypothetical protein
VAGPRRHKGIRYHGGGLEGYDVDYLLAALRVVKGEGRVLEDGPETLPALDGGLLAEAEADAAAAVDSASLPAIVSADGPVGLGFEEPVGGVCRTSRLDKALLEGGAQAGVKGDARELEGLK